MIERILIVGLGSIGRRHARLVRQIVPGVTVAALRHRQPPMGTPGIDHCFTRMDEAIAFRPQAAVIANPSPFHLEASMPLAEAGVHLLVEKPIASTVRGVHELIRVCRDKGAVLMTAYNLRFSPSLRHFREMLSEGVAGRVLSVRTEIGQFLPSWRPDADYRRSVSANAALGGGVLLELSHEIDYLRWLFGEVEWVSAVVAKQSALEIDVEDTAFLTIGFAGRDGEAPLLASLNMDCVRHDSTRTCLAVGETASLKWDGILGTVSICRSDAPGWRTLFEQRPERDESYLAEWRHFLECITRGVPPLVSGDDGVQALRIVEAARLSSQRRASIRIDECDRSGLVPVPP